MTNFAKNLNKIRNGLAKKNSRNVLLRDMRREFFAIFDDVEEVRKYVKSCQKSEDEI